MKNLCSILLALVLTLPAWAEDAGTVEKKKTIIKLYDVDAKDNLLVDNQFGQVKVNLWDKKEIRVQITITANASADDKVLDYLNSVEIEEKRNGDQIMLKTTIHKSGISNWKLGNWNDSERNFVKIDYDISMPRQNALSVKNRFGNTDIPMFSAPLTVYQRYGNFSATDLTGPLNDIDVAYGNADIRQLENGKLDIAYSNLDVDHANVMTLVNKFGKLKIGDVNKLDANIGYSGAKIGTLKQSCKIRLSFSGGFRIDQLLKTADDVDIQASYSSVALPVGDDSDCNFDVTVKYGGFNYPSHSMQFTTQPDTDERHGPKLTKQYAGKMGKGTGPKIRVVSSYGSVNFR